MNNVLRGREINDHPVIHGLDVLKVFYFMSDTWLRSYIDVALPFPKYP